MPLSSAESRMTMSVGHSETVDRVALEVEFDEDCRVLAHDPAIMARFDGHRLRRLVFDRAAVGVFDVDLAPGQETNVGVHAQVRADDRLHIDRPAESGRIHHALHAGRAGTPNLEPDVADFAPLSSFD